MLSKLRKRGLRGMESVVATVSGYHGTERFRLIKLIAQTGASYVGALAKSTTHLVCWEFEGKKYNLAKSFGTKIVSHQWFEDCLKAGRRLPEDPYVMQSGKQVGPLSLKLPDADSSSKKRCKIERKRNVLSDRSNRFDTFDRLEVGSSFLDKDWSSSYLLSKRKGSCSESSSRSSPLRRIEYSSSLNAQPARKSRRLVKKNAYSDSLDCDIIDCEECYPTENGSILERVGQEAVNLNFPTSGIPLSQSSSFHRPDRENQCTENLVNHYAVSEELGNIDGLGITPIPLVSNSCIDTMVTPDTLTKETYVDSDVNETQELLRIGLLDGLNGGHASELSCVICFTEFSLTRGVLPCGHRFCYSCIQDWADRVTANKKVPTCPLCKAYFTSITKVDGAASSDQKIYSQTIPCSSIMNVFVVPDTEIQPLHAMFPDVICYECHNHEPEDLLSSCHICNNQWVHSCCLDPPLVPWTCLHCRDLRTLYRRFR